MSAGEHLAYQGEMSRTNSCRGRVPSHLLIILLSRLLNNGGETITKESFRRRVMVDFLPPFGRPEVTATGRTAGIVAALAMVVIAAKVLDR